MRAGIEITVTAEDRRRLEAIAHDRNAALKHVTRAKVILATANGCGTMEIARRSGLSKPGVWRWQERFMHEFCWSAMKDRARISRMLEMRSWLPIDSSTAAMVRNFAP